ncbi:MAG: trypsin-like peptidase domain-containing protein [Candidatus Paceibacterota bacterium]
MKQLEAPKPKNNNIIWAAVILIAGMFLGLIFGYFLYSGMGAQLFDKISFQNSQNGAVGQKYEPQTTQEQKIIQAVKDVSPSVVSIVISKNMPIYQYQYNPIDPFGLFAAPQRIQTGTQKQEVGAGTGFIVSEDGLVLTNKHVASDSAAEYTVTDNNGVDYPAKIVAVDPVQDLAIIKIQSEEIFKPVKLGTSSNVQIGQTAIAIGNVLGEFQNTVSVGVISGLGRTIVASGVQGGSETLEDIIQTDAAINPGNSGGPLLNLSGEVIGVNTATSEAGQSIGFAISIDKAKRDIQQAQATGKISYPYLGVRYVIIDASLQKSKNLTVDYGALIQKGTTAGEPAITAGSPAAVAGLKDGDIILEFDNQKINKDNTLAQAISAYNPGQTINLKILRNKEEISVSVTLGEWKQ